VPKQLFGTDGIRGIAGQYPLDPETIYAFGVALGQYANAVAASPEVLIGVDTRESGPWLAEYIAGGLASIGVRVRYTGVMTTPGVAYLTRAMPFVAGVTISASHNPYQDNGIKVFGHSGFKLPDPEEFAIEQEILRLRDSGVVRPMQLALDDGLAPKYLEYLASAVAVRFPKAKLVLDCANGSAYRLAPELFRRLGVEVVAVGAEPNGRNINLNCGSLHPEGLRMAVLDSNAEFGVAFDGDADRAIFVSRNGKVVDGDGVLWICARALKAEGRLFHDVVVSTMMSGFGLEKAFEREGICLVRTPVGDKYVLEEMVRRGAALGAEPSGHVVFREYATTGDGMLTALRILQVMQRSGVGLDELTRELPVFRLKITNVRVREKKPLEEVPAVLEEIRRAMEAFAGSGRVIVRFSGTEPLARVMVEGPDPERVEMFCARIADTIRRELGV
jgi:phosphoglucosamine mutase